MLALVDSVIAPQLGALAPTSIDNSSRMTVEWRCISTGKIFAVHAMFISEKSFLKGQYWLILLLVPDSWKLRLGSSP